MSHRCICESIEKIFHSKYSHFSQMDFTNYKSWHIPRASLSSGSNSGQSSTDSLRNFRSGATRNHRKLRKPINEIPSSMPSSNSSSASSINARHKLNREKVSENLEKPHRGSRSSQGSSSDNSLHVNQYSNIFIHFAKIIFFFKSIQSSSSLLLSVANLENFTKLQEARTLNKTQLTQQNHFVLDINEADAIHQNQHHQKAKDIDQVSIASSTHFTVVNGFGRANIKPKSNSICRQGRQLTILIVTMSFLFMLAIMGAIYLMDSK